MAGDPDENALSRAFSRMAELEAQVARLEAANAAMAAALEPFAAYADQVSETMPDDAPYPYHPPMVVLRAARAAFPDTAGEDCRYCDKPPDGPMLSGVGHAPCVIRRLRELLDPDWEPDSEYEPLPLGTLGALDALGGKNDAEH